jgi:Cytochrome P460
MRLALVLFCGAMLLSLSAASQNRSAETPKAMPRYESGKLARPEGYREWIFLSAGLGMSYNPSSGGPELFTNVFVPQWAYHEFLSSGKWPDKTEFVLEERASESKGSINKAGHFQADLAGLAVQVKDETRYPEKWAYFNFRGDSKSEAALPKAQCWQCHDDNAAVDHTFVQFYPTLKPVAEKFGTYRK